MLSLKESAYACRARAILRFGAQHPIENAFVFRWDDEINHRCLLGFLVCQDGQESMWPHISDSDRRLF